MKATRSAHVDPAPETRKLTERQAARLSELSGVAAEELAGRTVAELKEKLGSILEPQWLLFRKVCGRVVKRDPVTGELLGVPFATVEVEDTDCNLISYYPSGFQWGWFFPFLCRREVIASTTTDGCGNFCVWVPRFDIDYVLRWRHHRYCFPEIFKRPNLKDLLTLVDGPVRPPRDPGDPAPYLELSRAQLQALAGSAGARLSDRLDRIGASRSFGGLVEDVDADLHARAFDGELPPPLPTEFHRALSGIVDVAAEHKRADPVEAVRSAVALKLGTDIAQLAEFHPQQYIGPFRRCIDIVTPEWDRIVDVPDITFKVLQDVNGDGQPETIYSEGYFDVRWDTGNIAPVTLVADDLAIASRACHTPDVVCSDVADITFAGLLPLQNTGYFDASSGYALRPNRPANGSGDTPPNASDLTRPVAQIPLCNWVNLFGCVDLAGAVYYRVEQRSEGQPNFVPIVGQARGVWDLVGNTLADAAPPTDGWYSILRPAAQYHPANLLAPVPPGNGRQEFRVQVADGSKTPIGSYSSVVAIQMDNKAPTITPTALVWKFAGEPEAAFDGPGRNLLVDCPTIHRGVTAADIVVRFEVMASAIHLRDAEIGTFGCGGVQNHFTGGDGAGDESYHWHTSGGDNTVALHGRYSLAANADEGSYGFTATARSRAVNPDDEAAELALWYSDDFAVWSQRTWNIAVVNSNG